MRSPSEALHNFKLLQELFAAECTTKELEVRKLAAGNFQHNLELLQWMKGQSERVGGWGWGGEKRGEEETQQQIPQKRQYGGLGGVKELSSSSGGRLGRTSPRLTRSSVNSYRAGSVGKSSRAPSVGGTSAVVGMQKERSKTGAVSGQRGLFSSCSSAHRTPFSKMGSYALDAHGEGNFDFEPSIRPPLPSSSFETPLGKALGRVRSASRQRTVPSGSLSQMSAAVKDKNQKGVLPRSSRTPTTSNLSYPTQRSSSVSTNRTGFMSRSNGLSKNTNAAVSSRVSSVRETGVRANLRTQPRTPTQGTFSSSVSSNRFTRGPSFSGNSLSSRGMGRNEEALLRYKKEAEMYQRKLHDLVIYFKDETLLALHDKEQVVEHARELLSSAPNE